MWVAASHSSNPHPEWVRISWCRSSNAGEVREDMNVRRILTIAVLLCAALAAAAQARPHHPDQIALPNGFQPEGIAIDGRDVFVGSIPTGAIWAGDLKKGRGDILVPGRPGRAAIGLKVDDRDRLFVSGGPTGKAFVYSARDGRDLAEYTLTPAPTFINDVTLTHKAAYFTDSQRQQLYVLDFGRHGRLPSAARTLPLTGDLQYDTDPNTFELNGIAASEDGRRLISVQSGQGKLFLIDPRSGDTEEIDLGGASVPNGDGLLLKGRTLFVVQNRLNQIAVIRLDRGYDDGRVVATITDPDFQVPTTIAASKDHDLWAVNARFGTPPGPDVTYNIVKVDGR
jgi:sugar lactone lactonase YvrE